MAATAKSYAPAEQVSVVAAQRMWDQSCKREIEISRNFMNQWGFMVDSNPVPPRDLEATSTVKYYSKGAWTINRKTIPSLNEFALKGSREETRVLGIETGNHTHRMGTLSRIPNPMFITTNSRYGGRLRPFDLYTLHGQKIVSTDVTNTRKIGVPMRELYGTPVGLGSVTGTPRGSRPSSNSNNGRPKTSY